MAEEQEPRIVNNYVFGCLINVFVVDPVCSSWLVDVTQGIPEGLNPECYPIIKVVIFEFVSYVVEKADSSNLVELDEDSDPYHKINSECAYIREHLSGQLHDFGHFHVYPKEVEQFYHL